MNDRPGARPERRRHVRTEAKGTAVVRAERLALRGRITNVGGGGMFVAARVNLPESVTGSPVDIELRLDAGFAQWVQGTGRIVRISADGVAIAFDVLPGELRDAIEHLATASRARARILSVVLIDAHAQRRSAMAAGFRGAGCAVIEATTPLEAIVRLGESSFEPDVIAIADSQPAASADELRSFVQRNHPNAKLVTIGDAVLEPDGIAHWLSSADPDADLSDRVLEILVRPRPVTQS
jgi:methylmalonyl-CoA mutase cobalamin-binding subunit